MGAWKEFPWFDCISTIFSTVLLKKCFNRIKYIIYISAFLAIESITAAENVTKSAATAVTAAISSTPSSLPKSQPSEAKNNPKRQINQFVRTPGANTGSNDGTEPESIDRVQAQSFPLQLTHSIYSQQPIYARRTTLKPEPQVVDQEQELERQQNEVCNIIFLFWGVFRCRKAKCNGWSDSEL